MFCMKFIKLLRGEWWRSLQSVTSFVCFYNINKDTTVQGPVERDTREVKRNACVIQGDHKVT